MISPVFSLSLFANASMSAKGMHDYLDPVLAWIMALSTGVFVIIVAIVGIRLATSAGNPEKVKSAKKHLKWAIIGIALILGASTLTGIVTNLYQAPPNNVVQSLPDIAPVESKDSTKFHEIAIKSIIAVFRDIITAIGQPFIQALAYFTNSTPLMAQNSNVFSMWLVIVGIANVLLILVIALLGFHVMTFSSLGFDEMDIKQLLPQILFIFVLLNSSIFLIDGIIGLSNGIIKALQAGFPCTSIWDSLSDITKNNVGTMGLGGLIVLMAFIVLTVILLIYYVGRLVALYLGAILSPLILLLWLMPAFKDFATSAAKKYLTVIFALFVQVVILQLASLIFSDILQGKNNGQPNALMALILGLSTIITLLKTPGVMSELIYAASTPKMARQINTFVSRNLKNINRGGRGVMKMSKKFAGLGNKPMSATTASGPKITITPSATQIKSTPTKTGETKTSPVKEKK